MKKHIVTLPENATANLKTFGFVIVVLQTKLRSENINISETDLIL